MVLEIFAVSEIVKPRTNYQVLAQLMQEVGELAQEVEIKEGFIRKFPGEDGILGEAVDVITCALDLIWLNSPNLTNEEIEEIIESTMKQKLEKWKHKQRVSS